MTVDDLKARLDEIGTGKVWCTEWAEGHREGMNDSDAVYILQIKQRDEEIARLRERQEDDYDAVMRLKANLANRDELLRRAAEPMREMVRNLVCTCAPAYRDRDLLDPSCCACEWMGELEQMERWLADYDVLTSAQVSAARDRSGIGTPDQGESIPEEGR